MMMLPPMSEMIAQLRSLIGGFVVAYAMFQNYFPYELRGPIKYYTKRYTQKFTDFFYPYIHITLAEYDGGGGDGDGYFIEQSYAYAAIKRYLNTHFANQARRLRANVTGEADTVVVLTMANHEEVTDEFNGVKLWWSSGETLPSSQTISWGPREAEKRYFSLTFHRRFHDTICGEYLRHVLEEGKAIAVKKRQQKLYTNSKVDRSCEKPCSLFYQPINHEEKYKLQKGISLLKRLGLASPELLRQSS